MAQNVFAVLLALLTLGSVAHAAEKYTGPRPPKPDLPYLLHADNILPTEAAVAKEDKRKDATAYTVTGAACGARTPLAEPIFILQAEKLVPEKMSAFKMEVRNGNREIVIPQNPKRAKNGPRPVPLKVTKLDERLYRLEVDQPLDNGEYTLSPEGANDTFCFQIY